MIKRTVKSSLNFCTVSQKWHNKQNDGADNKPGISGTNSFSVTPVHNHILQFFCGSFENTQSVDKREEGKTYGKCHGLRNSKRYDIFICQHVCNKINRNRNVHNPKGQVDRLSPDGLYIEKGVYRPYIYGKDKHEYKTKEVEMHIRTEKRLWNFIQGKIGRAH